MKISNNFKTISKAFVAAVTLSVVLAACSKRNDIQPIQAAGLSVINASPDAKELDFGIGNQRVTDDPFKYGNKLGYLALYPGISTMNVAFRGMGKIILSKQEIFESNKLYSTFIIDTGAKRAFLTVLDKVDAPAAGDEASADKAKIRFINLSPDAAALNIAVTGGTADLVTNKAFKEFSDFVAVTPGDNISFDIKETAAPTIVKATLTNVKLEKGKFYTIWAKGYKGKTDTDPLKFGAAVFTTK